MTDDTMRKTAAQTREHEIDASKLRHLAWLIEHEHGRDPGKSWSVATIFSLNDAKRLHEIATKLEQRTTTPAERPGDAALAERLRALRAKATPGPWSVATYCLRPGSPDQIERGLLMYGDDEGDDVSPTGVIDEKDMPGIGEESVSHDLDLIAELVNNLDAILAALTPSAPGSGTG